MPEPKALAAVQKAAEEVEAARTALKAAEEKRDKAVAKARAAGHKPTEVQEAAGLSPAGERVAAGRGGYRA